MAREQHTVTAVAGGHHAVHHIDTAVDGLEYVGRRAHAHQIAGTVLWQDIVDNLNHLIHHLGGLAHGKTADGVAVSAQVGDKLGRFLTQVFIDATLHDGEIGLAVAIMGLGVLEMFPATGEPVMGQCQGLAGIIVVTGTRRAFVQCHHDVAADGAFDVHHLLGGEQVIAAVDVAAKGHALVSQFAVIGKRKHLKATAIGKDGTVPTVKLVQSACTLDDIHTGSQVQVIGVAQDDLRLDILTQFSHVNCLYSSHRAHGHEDGGLDLTMVGRDESSTRIGALGCGYELIIHSVIILEKSCKGTKIVNSEEFLVNSFFY